MPKWVKWGERAAKLITYRRRPLPHPLELVSEGSGFYQNPGDRGQPTVPPGIVPLAREFAFLV